MNRPGILDSYGDPGHPDTICGIATPLGRGGIGVIRLSGPDALILASRMFHGKHSPAETPSHRILHGCFIDPSSGGEIDEIVLSVFRQPNSYTGEDVVEFSFHGSPAVLASALDVLTAQGSRLAAPGEFTFRAFCNGRIDLTQAEAVAELVSAKSQKTAQAAYRQLQGSLKDQVSQLRAELIEALAWLEISSDFVEEDLEFKTVEEIERKISSVIDQLATLERSYQRSRMIRDGLAVTIVGAPNTGKSSLFNRLLARERSIVTEIPGTTRDSIREYVDLAGYPVCLVDTAGIRKTEDAIEVIGIDRTIGHLEDSDVVLWVLDGFVGFTGEDERIHELLADRPACALVNKSEIADQKIINECCIKANMAVTFAISAANGKGIDELLNWMVSNYLKLRSDRDDYPFLINRRHVIALAQAREHLQAALDTTRAGESFEFVTFDVQQATRGLGEITGETTPNDVLNKIFADFCVGK